MIKRTFGETLSKLRHERNKSLSDLSRESGLALRFLREIEAGEKQPSLTTVFLLAASLDISAPELIEVPWEKWNQAGQPDN